MSSPTEECLAHMVFKSYSQVSRKLEGGDEEQSSTYRTNWRCATKANSDIRVLTVLTNLLQKVVRSALMGGLNQEDLVPIGAPIPHPNVLESIGRHGIRFHEIYHPLAADSGTKHALLAKSAEVMEGEEEPYNSSAEKAGRMFEKFDDPIAL
jgi:hypothetical protein